MFFIPPGLAPQASELANNHLVSSLAEGHVSPYSGSEINHLVPLEEDKKKSSAIILDYWLIPGLAQ